MTEPVADSRATENRPLVTFALFAYNQERFIREAVEGALSQTYEPLEIILSDDCSTDGTFEIMREMVQSYTGQHKVILRKNEFNLGVLKHVISVAESSNGQLIVMAAGDDVSIPRRVEIVVSEWQVTGAWSLFSKFDKIAENGDLIGESLSLNSLKPGLGERERAKRSPFTFDALRRYWHNGNNMTLIHGATSAYSKKAFDLLGNELPTIMSEDNIMTAALHWAGKKVHFIDQSLVHYRMHQQALSNNGPAKNQCYSEILRQELSIANSAAHAIKFNDWLLEHKKYLIDSKQFGAANILNDCEVFSDINFYEIVQKMNKKQIFISKFIFLLRYPKIIYLRWLIPRFFGFRFFALLKLIYLKSKFFDPA